MTILYLWKELVLVKNFMQKKLHKTIKMLKMKDLICWWPLLATNKLKG